MNRKQSKPIRTNKNTRTSAPKKNNKGANKTSKTSKASKTNKVSNTNKASKTSKSINALKNKKQLEMKYKRRRRLLILIAVVVFIAIIIFKSHGSTSSVSKYMTQGNNYVINNQYQNALNSYEEVVKLDSSNQKAKDLVEIIQCYLKAESYYKAGNTQQAEQTINGINPDYMRYPIGVKINQLKSELNNGQPASQSGQTQSSTDNEVKNQLMNLNGYYSDGQYNQALDLIKQINVNQLNQTQQAYVAQMSTSIDNKLGISNQGQSQLSKKGQYLNQLDKINVQVNNMNLSAQTYEQKLQRAKDKYSVWNNELDTIYNSLQNTLTATQVNQLQSGEAVWTKQKEQEATASEAQYNEQIVKETANYQTQRQVIKERCYYLVNNYM